MKMLGRPLLLAVIPAPIYLIVLLWDGPTPWELVLGSCIAYAAIYGLLGIIFGLEQTERKRITNRLRSLVS